MKYHILDSEDKIIVSNIDQEQLSCINECVSENELANCKIHGTKCRRGILVTDNGSLYLCTNEEIKSTRLFREKQAVFSLFLAELKNFRDTIARDKNQQVDRLIHDLITYNGKNLHSLYNLIPEEALVKSTSELNSIREVIQKFPKPTARTLLNILKNENLVKTEFSAYKKLFENQQLEFEGHEIRKVIFLILNTFRVDFDEKGILLKVDHSQEKVWIDYESVSAALTKIIDNIAKYSFPNSELQIHFDRNKNELVAIFDMMSVKVDPEENGKIFQEGYSGIHTKKTDLSGQGIGLYMANGLLKLNKATIKFLSKVSDKKHRYQNIPYEHNQIQISFVAYKE